MRQLELIFVSLGRVAILFLLLINSFLDWIATSTIWKTVQKQNIALIKFTPKQTTNPLVYAQGDKKVI